MEFTDTRNPMFLRAWRSSGKSGRSSGSPPVRRRKTIPAFRASSAMASHSAVVSSRLPPWAAWAAVWWTSHMLQLKLHPGVNSKVPVTGRPSRAPFWWM